MALCVQSLRWSYFTAQSRVCVCVCVCVWVSEHEEETWPVWGWDWGKFMSVLFDIMGLLSRLTSWVQQHPSAPLVCGTPSTLMRWLWYSCNYHLLLDCHWNLWLVCNCGSQHGAHDSQEGGIINALMIIKRDILFWFPSSWLYFVSLL